MAGAWLAAKRQLRQLRNAYKNRAPLPRLHIYHFKLPAAEAEPVAGLCGAAHTTNTHAHTHSQTYTSKLSCTSHNCLDSQTKATHGLSTFELAPREPTRANAATVPAPAPTAAAVSSADIEALHANIQEHLHQECLQYNIYF